MAPLVTIIVPTFDRIAYLTRALKSIRSQTFTDYVVIVADDCGPGNVEPILSQAQDYRVSYIRRDVNVGVARNIWSAMATSSTKYVTTLNDDDIWDPEFLEALLVPLEAHPEVTVGFSDFWHIAADERVLTDLTEASSRDFGRAMLGEGLHQPFITEGVVKRTIPAAMAAVFRHSAIDWHNFRPEVGGFYDEWLAYLAVRTGGAIWYTPRRLTRYRVHAGSETGLSGKSLEARLKWRLQEEFISRMKLEDSAVQECHPSLKRRNRRALLGLVIACILLRQPDIARDRIILSARFHPLWFWFPLVQVLKAPRWTARFSLATKHFSEQLFKR
jgi:glycosyltransferase involved in cell wall biosynthesis